MNKPHASCLTTIAQCLVLSLLLSQSTTVCTPVTPTLNAFNVCATSLAWVIGLSALRLELKVPLPKDELPKLSPDASLWERAIHWLDEEFIGQTRRTRFNPDGKTFSKCRPRKLGVLYEYFKFSLPGIAIFQTINKAKGSLVDFTQHLGLHWLLQNNTAES